MKAFRKSWDFRLTPKAREDQYPISKQLGRRYSVLFMGRVSAYSGLHQIGWGLPYQGRQSDLPSLPIQMLILSTNFLTDTPRIIFDQISGYLMLQSSWKINPHSWLRNICLAISSHMYDGKIRTILEIQGKNYYMLFLRYLFK